MIKRRYDSDVIIETIINNKKCFELSYNINLGFNNTVPEQDGFATEFFTPDNVRKKKNNDDSVYLIIKKYVDYYDFFGYLAMGAPEDEYDIETREIRKKINRYSSEKEIRRAVVNTFIEKFDADLSTDMFAESLEQMVRDIKSDLDEL